MQSLKWKHYTDVSDEDEIIFPNILFFFKLSFVQIINEKNCNWKFVQGVINC